MKTMYFLCALLLSLVAIASEKSTTQAPPPKDIASKAAVIDTLETARNALKEQGPWGLDALERIEQALDLLKQDVIYLAAEGRTEDKCMESIKKKIAKACSLATAQKLSCKTVEGPEATCSYGSSFCTCAANLAFPPNK